MQRRLLLGALVALVASAACGSALAESFYRAVCEEHHYDGKVWYGPQRRTYSDAEADCFNHHKGWPLHECKVKFFHYD